MISVRENTFETNSSSCHSLTIIKKSLAEKLKNKEVFYIGNYKCYSDCDEVLVNDLGNVPEKDLITAAQLRQKIKEWVATNTDTSEWTVELREGLSKLDLDNCSFEDMEEVYGDSIEEFANCHLDLEIEYPWRILGDSDAYVQWKKEIPTEDGDVEVIKLMDISC